MKTIGVTGIRNVVRGVSGGRLRYDQVKKISETLKSRFDRDVQRLRDRVSELEMSISSDESMQRKIDEFLSAIGVTDLKTTGMKKFRKAKMLDIGNQVISKIIEMTRK